VTVKVTNEYITTPNIVDIREYEYLSDAVTAIGSNQVTLVISEPFEVNESVTIPSNITLKFTQGGMFEIGSGYTVTINGHIEAGLYQIFSGNGSVTGTPRIDYIYPQWFGALADRVTNDRIAIQKANDFAESSGIPLKFITGDYWLEPYTVSQDAYVQNTAAYRCLKIDSSGTKWVFDSDAWLVVNADDDTYGVRGVAVVYLSGVSDCVIDGINIKNNTDTKPGGEYYSAIEVGSSDEPCTRVVIKHATIQYMGSGIRIYGSKECHVYNSYLHHCYDTAFNGQASKDCTIEDSTVTHSGDGNCTFYGGNYRCGIRNCYLTGASQVGVIQTSHYSFIEDCYFDGSDGSVNNGPIMYGCRFSRIVGNKIVGVNYGIRVANDNNPTSTIPIWGALIANNHILDCRQTLEGQVVRGLWLEYSQGVIVTGNTFERTVSGTAGAVEIDLLERGDYAAGYSNEHIIISNNQFILKHVDAGMGSYNDPHPVLINNTGETLEGMKFINNTIICKSNHNEDMFLLELNSARNCIIANNTAIDANYVTGPEHVLSGTLTDCQIIGNNFPYHSTDDPHNNCIEITTNRVIISNNRFGADKVTDPGSVLVFGAGSTDTIITDNLVPGCTRFICGDAETPPTNFIVKNNIIYYDFSDAFLNMDDPSNLITDNILTNY